MDKKENILDAVKRGLKFLENHKDDNTIDEMLSIKEGTVPDVDIDIKVNSKDKIISILNNKYKER